MAETQGDKLRKKFNQEASKASKRKNYQNPMKMERRKEGFRSKNPKVKLFFEMFSQLPSWFTNLWILVVASIYGIKGTQIFRNGGKK